MPINTLVCVANPTFRASCLWQTAGQGGGDDVMASMERRLTMATSSHVNRGHAGLLSSERLNDFEHVRGNLAQLVGEWRSRIRYRGELQRLLEIGPHFITDIGLKPDEVRKEINKPFWEFQAPTRSE
jgi:uncharacterized protein YjiS (DUF1127 family)